MDNQYKATSNWFYVVVAVLVSGYFYYTALYQSAPVDEFAGSIPTNNAMILFQPSDAPVQMGRQRQTIPADQTPLFPVNSAEHHESKQWFYDHGYYSNEDLAVYETYDDKTLMSLCSMGDVVALEVLAGKYIQHGKSEKAIPFIRESIARGSTGALARLAIFTLPDYTNEYDPVARKRAIIETFALYRVAGLRGDIHIAKTGLRIQERELEKIYGALDFTEKDYQLIDIRAQELYDQFQEERWRLGLGDFENNRSAYFEEYYSKKIHN